MGSGRGEDAARWDAAGGGGLVGGDRGPVGMVTMATAWTTTAVECPAKKFASPGALWLLHVTPPNKSSVKSNLSSSA